MRKAIIALAVVIGILAVLVAAVWTPDRSLESLKARWAPAPSKFVTVDGVAVHLRDEGPATDAHPIVLIHGTSSSLHTWDGWVQALKGQHRVIRFDLPGAGLTGSFADDDYSIAHQTRFVDALLDQLGIAHAILIGNSRGGHIAWETAVARPDLVDRLVLIDARGYPGDAGPPPLAVRIAELPVIGPLLMEHITPRSLIEKSLRQAYGDPRKLSDGVVDRYYELLLRGGNRHALLREIEQESYDDWARIKQVAAPTLILWGGLDHVVPFSHAERFHRDIANSQLVVFRALGHVPQEEDPAQTVRTVQDFLAR
ncbi:MAG: alpha/beta fold hydrolase [Alphaproteobacteria bacterium]|nr:alpha/beta fold hydrolase [Alphaproteobacteria bacterium]